MIGRVQEPRFARLLLGDRSRLLPESEPNIREEVEIELHARGCTSSSVRSWREAHTKLSLTTSRHFCHHPHSMHYSTNLLSRSGQDIYRDKKWLAFTSFTHVLLPCLPSLYLLAKAWLDAVQDCADPPTRAFWASWLWPIFAAKQLVPPLVPPTATLPDEQSWSLRTSGCWTKARWLGTPPALAELLQELAFARCDVSIAGGITSIAVTTIVAPSRRLIFFKPYLRNN